MLTFQKTLFGVLPHLVLNWRAACLVTARKRGGQSLGLLVQVEPNRYYNEIGQDKHLLFINIWAKMSSRSCKFETSRSYSLPNFYPVVCLHCTHLACLHCTTHEFSPYKAEEAKLIIQRWLSTDRSLKPLKAKESALLVNLYHFDLCTSQER